MAQRLMTQNFRATIVLTVLTVVAWLACLGFADSFEKESTCSASEVEQSSHQTFAEWTRFDFSASKMGVPVRLSFYASNESIAQKAADAVFAHFDKLNAILSDYDPESEIIAVCRKSSETNDYVALSPDLFRVLAFARTCTEKTDGAFDITVSPVVKLWRRSRSFRELPPPEYLEKARQLVGNDRWELQADPPAVRTLAPGVRFDVGGVAKGIALDDALEILASFGITSALLDAGGDLRIGDPPPGSDGWRVEFATLTPDDSERPVRVFANVGIACSGDTNRYVEINGVRYSHIIDPRTGNPLTEHVVVAVSAPCAADADALASAICVLGETEGKKILARFPGACLIDFLR
ncbi:MAG: FAD:protein FMN transferase [Planctomycetia bacterium]|nr:FAD:protein FMN transferase [Planctomycetia bacterium]